MGVERTPNKSQHTKLTLEKKILPPLLPGFEHATFRSRVRRFTDKLSRLPPLWYLIHNNNNTIHRGFVESLCQYGDVNFLAPLSHTQYYDAWACVDNRVYNLRRYDI